MHNCVWMDLGLTKAAASPGRIQILSNSFEASLSKLTWEETQESMPMSPGVKCRHTRAGSKSSASHMGAEPRTKCFKHTIFKENVGAKIPPAQGGIQILGDSAQGAHVHRVHRVSTCTECTECTEACSACKAGKYSSNVSNRCSQRH